MIIYLGNAAVSAEALAQDEPGGSSVTVVHPSPDASPAEILSDVNSLWQAHSDKAPSWVASDQKSIAELLASQFKTKVKTIDAAEKDYLKSTGAH